MAEHPHLRLVDRLRGIYHLPVNDGAGPLDGSYTFTRRFAGQPEIQFKAADMIEQLEDGVTILKADIYRMMEDLLKPDFYMNMPEAYVPPIHKEAAARLEELISE